MNYCEIGKRIRQYRNAKRLSQEELAEKINISTTHMSHIETGNTKLSLPVLVDLSIVLGVHTDDLLFDHPHERNVALDDLSDVLDACTPLQIRIIADMARALKISFDKHEDDK